MLICRLLHEAKHLTIKCVIRHGGVQLATTILQSEMATLTVPVMNMGRSELSNVMATLSLPGITERQSVLVGTLAPGETKSAKLTFIPGTDDLGLHQGTLTITGEDAYGNTASMIVQVETTVEEPVVVAASSEGSQEVETQTFPWLVIALGAGCGVLLMIPAAWSYRCEWQLFSGCLLRFPICN